MIPDPEGTLGDQTVDFNTTIRTENKGMQVEFDKPKG
jgi:hypothetical protein